VHSAPHNIAGVSKYRLVLYIVLIFSFYYVLYILFYFLANKSHHINTNPWLLAFCGQRKHGFQALRNSLLLHC